MCGICGIRDLKNNPIDSGILKKMTSIMNHRGPDGDGYFISNGIGLGHRRLSIIDIEGGAQPITNEDKSIQVIFNGEIYNFIELRKDLEEKGHFFKTRSDTEVIVHGYEEWGSDCVNHFNGIFAFAIWDSKLKRLFLARDHLGVKPLYYVCLNDRLLFASEIKSLLQDKDCVREVDINSLGQLFTFRYVPSPDTLFKNIKKLPPGNWMICSSDGIETRRYWNSKPQIVDKFKENDLIERYQELLEDSVRLQLRSDVPVGLFLSSGIDSSTILSIMREHITSDIYTFTIGFEDGLKTNETDDARQMARDFGVNHSEMIVGPEDYKKYYDRYLWDLEEPVGNETAAAFYFVSKIASEKVKVALCGQGADEPWAGYHRHLGAKLSNTYSHFPLWLSEFLRKMVYLLPRNERLKRGVTSLHEPDILTRLIKIYSFFSVEMKESLFQNWIKQEMNFGKTEANKTLWNLQQDVRHLDLLTQILYIDTRTNLPDDLLMVSDKTSMANSIEGRVPFLDYRLIEFIETIPSNLKLRGFQGKYLQKKAVAKWLPKSMICKKKKGFANPIDKWLQGSMSSYIDDSLLSEKSAVNQYFNKEYIQNIITLNKENREDYWRHINLLVSFELWHQQFIKH